MIPPRLETREAPTRSGAVKKTNKKKVILSPHTWEVSGQKAAEDLAEDPATPLAPLSAGGANQAQYRPSYRLV